MSLPRLTANSLTADCYQALKGAILNLDLVPGTPLVESDIASQLGTSKTPVREALARLAGEGLVVIEPGRRTFVAGLSAAKARELYQLRIILETASIRDVTPSITEADLVALRQLTDVAAQAIDTNSPATGADASDAFHRYLINKNPNKTLVSMADWLFDQVRRVRISLFLADQGTVHRALSRRGIEHHYRILAALERRDPEQAAEEMRADIQVFLDLMSTPVIQHALEGLAYRR